MSDKTELLREGFVDLLRACVYAQDNGVPVGEVLCEVFGHSGAHAMSEAIHNTRLRMIHEGIQVRVPPKDRAFILGFADEDTPEK